jgi:hypothetical protein
VLVAKLRNMKGSNRLGGFGQCIGEFRRNRSERFEQRFAADTRIGDVDAIEFFRQGTNRRIATGTDLGEDRTHCFSGTFSARIGSREFSNEFVAIPSAEIDSVQHDIGR